MHMLASQIPLQSLLLHPEFLEGVADGHLYFCESYEEAPLSEQDIVEEIETNLSRRVTEHSAVVCRMHGWGRPSIFYNLGYVLGVIDKGLSYAQ